MFRRFFALIATAALAGPAAAGDPAATTKTFTVRTTNEDYCDPLCVVIHPSATRVTLEVFGDDKYYGRVLYHDSAAATTTSETLTPRKTITTAAVAGRVTIEMKAATRAAATFRVAVTAEAAAPPAARRPREADPDGAAFEDRATDALVRQLEAVLKHLEAAGDDDTRRFAEQLDELKARRPRPPAKTFPPPPFPPAPRPGPVPPVVRPPLPVPPAGDGVERSALAARSLHVLLVIDTHAEAIGANMMKNEEHLRAALAAGLSGHPAYRPPTVLSGTWATPENVRKYFRDQPKAGLPQDAVLVVYTGHGGMVRNEHVFTMRYGDMNRSEVRRLLDGCGAGLGVLFSDCCANRMQSLAADRVPPSAVLVQPQSRAAGPSPLADLLLHHRGRVDLTACRPGAVAWCDNLNGGHFTKAFVDAAAGVGPVGYEPPAAFTSWGAFWDRVRGNTLRYPNRVVPVANTPLNK